MPARSPLSTLPATPAIYALMGGHGSRAYVAYVGIAGKLRGRIRQHLVLRDSSVTTGTSATMLNPDYVTQVRWWTSPEFGERTALEAAELIAIDQLDPALRSRGEPSDAARQKATQRDFAGRMRKLVMGDPSGSLEVPTLEVALSRIHALEKRVESLEDELDSSGRA